VFCLGFVGKPFVTEVVPQNPLLIGIFVMRCSHFPVSVEDDVPFPEGDQCFFFFLQIFFTSCGELCALIEVPCFFYQKVYDEGTDPIERLV